MSAAEDWMSLCDDLDRTTDQFMAALERGNRRLLAHGRRPLTEDDVSVIEKATAGADILPFQAQE